MTDIIGPANAPNAVTVRPTDTRAGFGSGDTWFKDCSSVSADDGTDIQAGWLNKITAVVRNAIRGNGNTLAAAPVVPENDADDGLLLKGMQYLIQRGQTVYADDTGTVNALVATLSPAAPEYVKGMEVRVKIANTNTSGAVTLNVNGLGTKAVARVDGQSLRPNDLNVNSVARFIYDGTQFLVIPSTALAAPRFISRLAADQSLGSGVNNVINFTTFAESFGLSSGMAVSAGIVTLGTGDDGLWLFIGNMITAAGSGLSETMLFKNGTQSIAVQANNETAGWGLNASLSAAVRMSAGDTISLIGNPTNAVSCLHYGYPGANTYNVTSLQGFRLGA